MRDRVCPIGDCTATVEFETAVVEVTPRYQLHDLTEVDEFAECPSCEAEIAGFYDEDGERGATDADGDDGVELILNIDDDAEADDASTEADVGDEFDPGREPADDDDSTGSDGGFDDPDAVLADVDDEDDEDDEDVDDEDEFVFE